MTMTGPFVYTPHSEYFPPLPGPYFAHQQNSPLIPGEIVYPSSPYVGPPISDLSSPNTPTRILFSVPSDYGGHWNFPRPKRRRRLSWHGSSAPNISPFIPPPFLHPHETGAPPNSWGNRAAPANWFTSASQPHPAAYPPAYQPHSAAYPPAYPPYQPAFPPYTPATNPQLLPIQIHPWLNGDLPSSDLLFDLSVTAFAPKRRINAEQAVDLTQADFLVPAFHPPLTKLHIVCDMLPHWPIDLVYPYGYTAQAPPITVGDVLIVIHQKLHQRISHTEWGRLSMSEETAVSRAFTHRCRKEAIRTQGGFMSDLELPERSQGVKVVDFLHGRNHFRGLVRADDGSVRLLVA